MGPMTLLRLQEAMYVLNVSGDTDERFAMSGRQSFTVSGATDVAILLRRCVAKLDSERHDGRRLYGFRTPILSGNGRTVLRAVLRWKQTHNGQRSDILSEERPFRTQLLRCSLPSRKRSGRSAGYHRPRGSAAAKTPRNTPPVSILKARHQAVRSIITSIPAATSRPLSTSCVTVIITSM